MGDTRTPQQTVIRSSASHSAQIHTGVMIQHKGLRQSNEQQGHVAGSAEALSGAQESQPTGIDGVSDIADELDPVTAAMHLFAMGGGLAPIVLASPRGQRGRAKHGGATPAAQEQPRPPPESTLGYEELVIPNESRLPLPAAVGAETIHRALQQK